MAEIKINFMGILANTDSSILKMKLNHGFTIEEKSSQEISEIISTLENISIEASLKELIRNFVLFIPTGKVYLINKTFNVGIQEETSIICPRTIDAVLKFDEIIFHGYLNPTIRLMRLYKEGNICIPFEKLYLQMHMLDSFN